MPVSPANPVAAVERALRRVDPTAKCRAVHRIVPQAVAELLASTRDAVAVEQPGRPQRPVLVSPSEVPQRGCGAPAGRIALAHAVAHIEFNAVNLALDAALRFTGLPVEYYREWITVAQDEARHFGLLREWLCAHGADYGDLSAHNGLWEAAEHTAHDPLARMALVPRVLEARGLDVTPGLITRLRQVGERGLVAVLEVILSEEVAHVAIGAFPDARDVLEPYGFSEYSHIGITDGSFWEGFRFDGQTASESARWLHSRKNSGNDKPWFLAVNFINPHDICWFDETDHQFRRTRLRKDFLSPVVPPPMEGVYNKDWDVPLLPSYYKDPMKHKPWAQYSYIDECNAIYGHLDRKDERRWRAYQSFYFNCIRDVDRHAVTVLDALDATGFADDTIVIYVADHGDMLSAHGLRQKGPTMYKENVRVPLIVRHPDASGGVETQAIGSCVDLVPTILSMCGVDNAKRAERHPQLKGADLSAAVAKPSARTERDTRGHLYDYDVTLYIDPTLTENAIKAGGQITSWAVLKAAIEEGRVMRNLNNPGLFRGVFDGRYKFARYFKPSQYHTPKDWKTLLKYNQLELYDTKTDPDEINNLAADPETHKPLIEALNAKTNALVKEEVGVDDGSSNPGPDFLYKLGG